MRLAVAVVTWNGGPYVGSCLQSLVMQSSCPDVLVLDNASADDTVEIIRRFAEGFASRHARLDVIVESENSGFTIGANRALRVLLSAEDRYDAITVLNQDVVLAPDWLTSVQDLLVRSPDVGAIGTKTFHSDGITVQHAGGYLSRPRLVGLHYGQHEVAKPGCDDTERDVEFVTGAVITLRVACLRQVGLFDEIFAPGYYEDVDLCARIRAAGRRVVFCPGAQARHVESASFTDRGERFLLSHRNRLIFAMSHLAEDSFAAEFYEAERAALAREPFEVLRALSLAYLQTSLRVRDIAEARLPSARRRRSVVAGIVKLLERLREDSVAEIQRRRGSEVERVS